MSSDGRMKLPDSYKMDWSQLDPSWTTTASSIPEPMTLGNVGKRQTSDEYRNSKDIYILREQVSELFKRLDVLAKENEYLKDMMNEEFRSKHAE